MEDNWAKLIKKYKSLIVPKDGDFEGIIQYAQRNYTITCITKSYLEMLDAKIFIDNIAHTIEDQGNSPKEIEVEAYEIVEDTKSKNLYKIQREYESDPIFFAIEKNSLIIHSNSNELFCELAKERSIPQKDYDEETDKLKELIALFVMEKDK